MKKKIIALILASVMTLSFSACTGSEVVEEDLDGSNSISNKENIDEKEPETDEKQSDNNIESNNDEKDSDKDKESNNDEKDSDKDKESNNDEKDSDKDKESNNDEKDSDNTTKEEEKEPESNNQNNESFKHGEITAKGYKSSFFNIEIECGDDWVYLSDDEELAFKNRIEDMSDENVNKLLDESGSIKEVAATKGYLANIEIIVENLDLTNGGNYVSAEEYLEAALPDLEENLLNAYKGAEVYMSTITLCGETLPCIMESVYASPPYSAIITAVPKGKYMAIISFVYINDEDLNILASAFKSIG